jgi:hypothetical protein
VGVVAVLVLVLGGLAALTHVVLARRAAPVVG